MKTTNWILAGALVVGLGTPEISQAGGTIVGKVVLDGDASEVLVGHTLSKTEAQKLKRSLVVSDKGGVANVAVYLEGAGPTAAPLTSPIDQIELARRNAARRVQNALSSRPLAHRA